MINKPDVIKAALSVGKQEINVYERQIWNEAIEEAANVVNTELGVDSGYVEKAVRKLKK